MTSPTGHYEKAGELGRPSRAPEQAPVKRRTAGSSGATFRDEFGIVTANQVRRKTFARFIQKPVYIPAKSHVITVDCRTGKKTITALEAPTPAKISPPSAPIPKPTIFRTDGVLYILKVVARHWGVGVPAILGPIKTNQMVYPRTACMQIISERMPSLSLPMIGRALNRHHTTVLAGLERAVLLRNTNLEWRRKYNAALAELESGVAP